MHGLHIPGYLSDGQAHCRRGIRAQMRVYGFVAAGDGQSLGLLEGIDHHICHLGVSEDILGGSG